MTNQRKEFIYKDVAFVCREKFRWEEYKNLRQKVFVYNDAASFCRKLFMSEEYMCQPIN